MKIKIIMKEEKKEIKMAERPWTGHRQGRWIHIYVICKWRCLNTIARFPNAKYMHIYICIVYLYYIYMNTHDSSAVNV